MYRRVSGLGNRISLTSGAEALPSSRLLNFVRLHVRIVR